MDRPSVRKWRKRPGPYVIRTFPTNPPGLPPHAVTIHGTRYKLIQYGSPYHTDPFHTTIYANNAMNDMNYSTSRESGLVINGH